MINEDKYLMYKNLCFFVFLLVSFNIEATSFYLSIINDTDEPIKVKTIGETRYTLFNEETGSIEDLYDTVIPRSSSLPILIEMLDYECLKEIPHQDGIIVQGINRAIPIFWGKLNTDTIHPYFGIIKSKEAHFLDIIGKSKHLPIYALHYDDKS